MSRRVALTKVEQRAVAALREVAHRWPQTLALLHMGCSRGDLHVVFYEPGIDPIDREVLATIGGFRVDSTS